MYKKGIVAALVLATGALSFTGDAEARQRWHRGYHGHHHGHHGGAFAAGAIGFGAGAILGSALAAPRYYAPRYYEPAPIYVQPAPVYVQPAPVYGVGPVTWSPDWYSYCSSRYRSFNPQTGYYLGYDGQYHLCR